MKSKTALIFFLSLSSLSLSSCAAVPNLQPQVNALVAGQRFQKAVDVLNSPRGTYGKNNDLLYLLDKAYVLQLAGHYSESIRVFEQAKQKKDDLYTQSISRMATTWLVNDNTALYRGEDFESIMVHIFQSINFAILGDRDEAIVEARQADSTLTAINRQYDPSQQNVYREDAFARLLMGIFYETGTTFQDLNDAFISYRKATDIYEKDYSSRYSLSPPRVLKENLLTCAQWMGSEELLQNTQHYRGISYLPLSEKQRKSEIYLIHYNGLSPIKLQHSYPFVSPDGYGVKFSFPKYEERFFEIQGSRLVIKGSLGQWGAETELGEDISKIAIQNLEDRKWRIMAKAGLRPVGKYFLEKQGEEAVTNDFQEEINLLYKGASSFYNYLSEQADLRSWQTLPAQIRIARLIVDPGVYRVSVEYLLEGGSVLEELSLGEVSLDKGQKRFFVVRSSQ